jgi:tryptophan halogenase
MSALGDIVIVGGGVDAWMTAAVLARVTRGLAAVTVAETAAASPGRIAALPVLRALHARLGLGDDVLAAADATPCLAMRFGDHLEPFGETGAAMDGAPFHAHWLRAGDGAPLSAWSLAAQAALRGRFAPRSADPRSPLSTLDHGLSLDGPRYTAQLRSIAEAAGATRVAGTVDSIERDGDRIAAIRIAGLRLPADLFVDATGVEGLLIAGEPWLDWSHWLPAGARLAQSGLILSFAPTALKAGRRARVVVGNVVAVGEAAAAIGAGDGGDLHLLQTAVSRLAALYPNSPAAAAEFNRLTEAATERARDMAILRWGSLADPPPPLAWRLAQFESRGRVVTYDEETWPESAWVYAMLARGVVPRRWDPLAERIPLDQARERLGRMKALLAQAAEGMPRADAKTIAIGMSHA